MKNLKRILIVLFSVILVVPVSVQAQKEKYANLREALFAAGNLNAGGAPSNVTWIEDGEKYSFTRNDQYIQEIWIRTINTGKEEKVFSNEDLTFPETEQPFRYVSFAWTKDYNYILFQCNFNPIWRFSGNSDYYLYSVKDKSLDLIVKQAFSAEISPDGKKVGYGKDGDLYEFVFETDKHIRFTEGSAGHRKKNLAWYRGGRGQMTVNILLTGNRMKQKYRYIN